MKRKLHAFLEREYKRKRKDFAELLDVSTVAIFLWLQREKWVSDGADGDPKGIGIDQEHWELIYRLSNKSVDKNHLHEISKYKTKSRKL